MGYRNEERGREWEREGELEWGEKEKNIYTFTVN